MPSSILDDSFDFGFTAVHEEDLETVQTLTAQAEDSKTTQQKLDKIYKAILPLLKNLKENPEKDYIYWPNRLDKVNSFERMIKGIYDK
jgi:ubiquinone/menaquinone biosynthesis C-methylase UbiE